MRTNCCRHLGLLFGMFLILPLVKPQAQETSSENVARQIEAAIKLVLDAQRNENTDSELEKGIEATVVRLQAHKGEALYILLRYAGENPDPYGRVRRATILLREKLDVSPQDVLDYVVPKLQADPGQREALYDLVSSVPDPTGQWLDYRFSLEFLQSQRDAIYPPFVQYAYAVYPQKAVVRLIEACVTDADRKARLIAAAGNVAAHSQMELTLRGEAIDDATIKAVVADLHVLAQSKEWWLRYYAARFLRYGPVYRDKALLAALKADPDPLVKEVLSTAK